MPLLIRNGRLIDPASKTDRIADLAVHEGRIAAIGGKGRARTLDVTGDEIDAQGLIVAPGLIDPHVHLREPGHESKETIATGSSAAVAGGFSTVCCMPNTLPALDSPELIAFIARRAEQKARCRVFTVAAATKGRRGEELAEIALLAKAGAVGFSDDGDCIASAALMARALAEVKETGLALMQHAQEPTMTRGASMHAGAVATRLGLGGWPRAAEEVIVERDVRLNMGIGCRYHVQHVSSAGTVEIIRRARKAGQPVSAEAAPHHLLLTHDSCDGYNTLAKVNPPLRERSDVQALREGVADGTITVLATDHAPHTADDKLLPFEEAPFGLVGLESALAVYAETLVRSGAISWPRLIALLTIEPAKLCGLERCGMGTIRVGGPADLTLIDPEFKWTLGTAELKGRCTNTPLLGRSMRARAVATIVGGRIVHSLLADQATRA